jgi:nucleoside-triphosphatase
VPAAPLRLLLEGRPGSGKTTAAARLVKLVRADGMSVSGFLTHELREGGERVGFVLETLDGRRGMLAHVGLRGGVRVGRYGVVLDELESLAIPALRAHADLVVADELGNMELVSGPFRDAVTALFERPVAVIATVHTHAHPFTDDLKSRPSVTVLRLTRANRDELPTQIALSLRAGRDANQEAVAELGGDSGIDLDARDALSRVFS